MSSPLNSESYRLAPDAHQTIFEQRITPEIFAGASAQERPVVVIFGGQPGAGKSAAVDVAFEGLQKQGGAAQIIGDELRSHHPSYAGLLQKDDKTAAFYTDKDTALWIEKSIQVAIDRRVNVVIEGTMRDPDKVAATMQNFRAAGYFVDARVLAVNERMSQLGVLLRYEEQKQDAGFGRMTTPEAHKAAYSGMLTSLDRVHAQRLTDRLTILDRTGGIIHLDSLSADHWQTPMSPRAVVEAERARPWSTFEVDGALASLARLDQLLSAPERHAQSIELEAAKKLRAQIAELSQHSQSQDAKWDAYFYPQSNVLENKVGIRDGTALSAFERDASTLRLVELRQDPVRGNFDLPHLKKIHGRLFQDVYKWAGQLRDVEIEKNTTGSKHLFSAPEQIESRVKAAHLALQKHNYLRVMDRAQFGKAMGEVFAHINQAHPFREGNDRAIREYLYELGQAAGYKLGFDKVDAHAWNAASRLSGEVEGRDLRPMQRVFTTMATSERALAFDKMPIGAALARHPELMTVYKELRQALDSKMDVENIRAALSKTLHEGRIQGIAPTPDESVAAMGQAAAYRGLAIHQPDELKSRLKAEVVAVDSHHALTKVKDGHAVLFEKARLDRYLNVGDVMYFERDVRFAKEFKVTQHDAGAGQLLKQADRSQTLGR